MNVEHLTEDIYAAREKWREYKDAAKKTRDPLYDDLKKVYNQIKNGKSVINIFDAIKAGGIHANNCHPKLAIARASEKMTFCRYWMNRQQSNVFYSPSREGLWWGRDKAMSYEFSFVDCLPQLKEYTDLRLQAPVPIIPPRLRPAKLTDEYFILWEVDSWTPIPSRDPYLLRRLTKEMFVVLAAWDLTDIELKVMQGRVTR